MINRYSQPEIDSICNNLTKFELWQRTELAVLQARAELGDLDRRAYKSMRRVLLRHPIDVAYIDENEKVTNHDLIAFLAERQRFLQPEHSAELHRHMTSYCTEESAFVTQLKRGVEVVFTQCDLLEKVLISLIKEHRGTLMFAETHGQWAKLQTLGKKLACYVADLRIARETLTFAAGRLKYSRIAGATGSFGGMDPKIAERALEILGFEQYYGSTQILPRILFVPISDALVGLVMLLGKIADDIRLLARSGDPFVQEGFAPGQKGSSAMPNKRNTIIGEGQKGFAFMVLGYQPTITSTIATWNERDISQSRVERVVWPDLFHVTVASLKQVNKLFTRLEIYPDNMLFAIRNSGGTYAAEEVKDWLKGHGREFGLKIDERMDDFYGIAQLASFNVFEPTEQQMKLRKDRCVSSKDMDEKLFAACEIPPRIPISIREQIRWAELRPSPNCAATVEDVARWNAALKKIFKKPENQDSWEQIFRPSYLLRHEGIVVQKILGEG